MMSDLSSSEAADLLKRLRHMTRQEFGDSVEQEVYDEAISGELEDEEPDMKTILKLLYKSSCARILLIADKLARYHDDTTELKKSAAKFQLPGDKYWGFELGNRVKVKGTFQEFKAIQGATLGWERCFKTIYGETGIIKTLMSGYDNAVDVIFPRVGKECTLFSGVLEKTTETEDHSSEYGSQASARTTWRNVGEMVIVRFNPKLVSIKQRSLIPSEKKGQIVGFAEKKAIVTFDGQTADAVKTSVLFPSPDKTPIRKKEISHPRGFLVGQKVTMIKNMRKLIENQEDAGEWNEKMSNLRGKEVTIVNIQEDGSLNVQCKHDRPWRVNSDSVFQKRDKKPTKEDDLPFLTGDVVKVKIPQRICLLLEEAKISFTFIEYLRLVGEVGVIGDEYEPYVRFNNEKFSSFNNKLLCVLPDAQKKEYLATQRKVNGIKSGSIVYLDAGPPNFVKEVLRKASKSKSTIAALTKPSRLMGFLANDKAVIEYDDGSRYKINAKYLTVPERFDLKSFEETLDVNASQRIVADVQKALLKNKPRSSSRNRKPIKSIRMTSGNPPSIHIGVNPIGTSATSKDVIQHLRKTQKRKLETLGEGQFMLCDDFGEVKVGLSFTEDQTGASEAAVTEESVSFEEASSPDARAEPFVDSPLTEQLQVDQFHYLRLHNRELTRDVCFPYLVKRTRTQPQPTLQAEAAHSVGTATNTSIHIYDSQINNLIVNNMP